MDGLIVDSEPFWRRAHTEVYGRLGVDARPFLGHGHTMGLRVDEAIRYISRAVGLPEHHLAAIEGSVVSAMVDAITNEAELLPGVVEALDSCENAGLVRALASGSTPPVIDAVLDRFGLRAHFDGGIYSAIDDPLGKPHPGIFLRAAASMGIDATACCVIEDSLNGCIAACAARMAVIAVPHPDDVGDPRFAIADVICASLEQFAEPPASVLLDLDRRVATGR
jgi:sugar-phosphatase